MTDDPTSTEPTGTDAAGGEPASPERTPPQGGAFAAHATDAADPAVAAEAAPTQAADPPAAAEAAPANSFAAATAGTHQGTPVPQPPAREQVKITHPVRGILWGILFGLGLMVVAILTKVIALSLVPALVVLVLGIALGTLWSLFAPPKQLRA